MHVSFRVVLAQGNSYLRERLDADHAEREKSIVTRPVRGPSALRAGDR
jgi:hypothetical protein